MKNSSLQEVENYVNNPDVVFPPNKKNLSNFDLRELEFSDENFDGATFDNCNLARSRFIRCSLIGTIFKNTNIEDGYFEESILDGSMFDVVNFENSVSEGPDKDLLN